MRFLVDLHTHTNASQHAYSTIKEYFEAASDKGIAMFATTDHGPDLQDGCHPWHFGNLGAIPHIVDKIALLRGIECNIRAGGSIDLDNSYLKRLDIVLAGFHESLEPSTKDKHTAILLHLIEAGKVDIITHLGNPRYPFDHEQVLACAKEHNVAIELNGSSGINTRKGSHPNCVEIAKLAAKMGNVIALGSDAHSCYRLGDFRAAEKVLEEAGIGYDHILNTSPIKVLDFLEARGHEPIESLRNFFTPF